MVSGDVIRRCWTATLQDLLQLASRCMPFHDSSRYQRKLQVSSKRDTTKQLKERARRNDLRNDNSFEHFMVNSGRTRR